MLGGLCKLYKSVTTSMQQDYYFQVLQGYAQSYFTVSQIVILLCRHKQTHIETGLTIITIQRIIDCNLLSKQIFCELVFDGRSKSTYFTGLGKAGNLGSSFLGNSGFGGKC